ncbi:hypothetical protein [Thermocatellispora tengchongensis]|uniref:hypothetical protein n=1 Tax=Thermocatellispora tengchongensis TaxID=1073253 RepID=UPI003629DA1D
MAVAMLAAGGGAYHLATRASGPPAATPPPATHRVAISAGPMPLTASATVTVPETSIKVRENPADPVWLSTAYDTVGDGPTNHAAYVRDPKTGEFAFFGNYQMPVASPGGAFLASLPGTNLDAIEANTLRLVDRARGEDVQLRVAGKPGVVTDLQWNEDQRLVLTIWDDRENGRTLGFVIVDAATKAVTVGKTPGGGVYSWAGPDHVIHQTADHTVRVLDLAGREVRSFRNVGELHPVGVAPVAGYGEVFSTACPPPDTGVCLWDAVTGAREAVVPIAAGARFDGWLDERHYLAVVTAGRKSKVVMVDLAGKAVRTLAEGPAGELERIALWFTRR